MPPARKKNPDQDTAARTALLDAAQELMLEEGYAAVSTRKVAAKAGTNSALVYYYFGNMDDLFIALFRRGAERSYERQAAALASRQPLWGLWDITHDLTSTALIQEFQALANHRKAIRAEIAKFSRKFRRMQLDGIKGALAEYGVDGREWPAVSILILMSGISRFLLVEEEFGVTIGHAETVALVERHIRNLEGERDKALRKALLSR